VDLEDSTVGLCFDCGFSWCLECGYELTGKVCAHWALCDDCEKQEVSEEGFVDCPYDADMSECPSVKDFMDKKSGASDSKGGEPDQS
jgi:hypothetical protein